MSATDQRIMFTCIDVKPTGNKKLEKDGEGYYKVDLGAFNCFNSAGEFYLKEGIEEVIKSSSSAFVRRITTGRLKGEAGHPVYLPGMTPTQYYARNMRIELSNISHSIKSVEIVPTSIDSGLPGKGNIVKVEGWVKPMGDKGLALAQDLEDPNCNTAFSIRCITNNKTVGGITHKQLDSIITWDWVVEPGIQYAGKFDTLKNTLGVSIESMDLQPIDIKAITSGTTLKELLGFGNISIEEDDFLLEVTRELATKYSRQPLNKHILSW